MSLFSSFVNWWKTSSAQASAAHYSLRFDASETNQMRGGALSPTAREKIKLRIAGVKKQTAIVLGGCLLPILLIVAAFFSCVGYSIYNSRAHIGLNPVSICFSAFILLFVAAIVSTVIGGAIKLQTFRRRLRADLHNARVAIEQGRVNIKVVRSRNGSHLEYRINGIVFLMFSDAIGAEIHQHFLGGVISGGNRETVEEYRFYYLPQSKLVLHFESA